MSGRHLDRPIVPAVPSSFFSEYSLSPRRDRFLSRRAPTEIALFFTLQGEALKLLGALVSQLKPGQKSDRQAQPNVLSFVISASVVRLKDFTTE